MNQEDQGPWDARKHPSLARPPSRQPRPTPEVSESILKSLKDRVGLGKGTSEWVSGLSAPSGGWQTLPQAAADRGQAGVFDMVHTVDNLFDLLTKYAFELNRTLPANSPALEVERPVHVKAGDPRYGDYGQAAFSGRLTFHQWSLVIRGHENTIEGIIMPSHEVLRFNADPEHTSHPRFVKLEQAWTGQGPVWQAGSKPLRSDQLPAFAQQLIGALVRHAKKGKATRSFRFDWSDVAGEAASPAAGPHPDSGYGLPPRPESYYSDAERSLTAAASAGNAGGSTPPVVPAQAPPSAQASDRDPARSRAASVADALDFAQKEMGKKLDVLAQTLSEAMKNQDPARAERHRQVGLKVKDLQDKTRWLLQQWLSVYPEG